MTAIQPPAQFVPDAPLEKRTEDLNEAVRVLTLEADGLKRLAGALGEEYKEAIALIHEMKSASNRGRLIVAGIGKSGHVARKIAATMASTGTPAYFVHPGEASHGDLGMITPENDIVLMLSNSGENAELSDLIHYTRRYGMKLISITSNPKSTLASHSDVVLLLPKIEEACPHGLAPTTSTTMMMALGDALAVSLLSRMKLTPEQYKVFHPGGKLGRQLLSVAEIMKAGDELPLIKEDANMGDAIIELTSRNLGCVLVVDDKMMLKGIVTDGDLKRHMGPDLLEKPVKDVMTVSPKSIEETALAAEAVNIMTRTPGRYITSLVVYNPGDGSLKGMIRLQDCLQAGIS